MPRSARLALLGLISAIGLLPLDRAPGGRGPEPDRPGVPRGPEAGPGRYPSDWFFSQRAWPGGTIPQEKFVAAMAQARVERALPALREASGAALTWTQAGPCNIGGRVTALAAAPGGTVVYLGSANGGVFKSANSGANWTPIFDGPYGAFSIGALALDPGHPDWLYVGTGESNAAIDTYDGSGLFRSKNGGATWEFLGLAATRRIARVAVDPADSNRIFVAAMGTQFSTGPDRGLYRSEDGGSTWSRVLFANDSTGVADVAVNPAHPETVFCATWERVRHQTYRRPYGPGCGVWRSIDHGTTWTRLAGGLPAASDGVGRIGIAIAPSRPSTVYAQIGTGASGGYAGLGLYRTTDGGDTWARRDGGTGTFTGNFGGFCWYFGDVVVDPANADGVYSLGVDLIVSNDGGASWGFVTGAAHVDQHALWVDPSSPLRCYLGNDGGFFSSTTGAGNWTKSLDLPISQFYGGTVDPQNPARLLGGTQDNGTLQTTGSPAGWTELGIGGDGFQCLVDPTNSNVVFAEWQFCCSGLGLFRSTNGGAGFGAPTGFNGSDRYNWCTPIAMNPRNHNLLLVGSQRVYRSTDNGLSYAPISGDLSTQPVSQLTYGTLTTLEISAADTNTYYAGTDDGKVWRSTNRGGLWSDISAGLPVRSVTRVTADPVDPATVYVTLSGFGSDEHLAHVYRSTDRGTHWTSIAGSLPDAPANDLLVDPTDTRTLFLATDVGVYVTQDLGAGWFPLGQGMPVQTVFDLSLHAPSRTLIAATHGRSQWKLDLTLLPVAADPRPVGAAFSLSAPAPNPSRGEVRLTLELPAPTAVDGAIYDLMGRRIRTLESGVLDAGTHAVAWDGADRAGRRAAAGVYFLRLSTRGSVVTRRIVRLD